MGSYDGAETCELVGTYLLCQLPKEISRNQIGLYRDDGLAAFRTTARKIEQIKKSICKVFSNNQLQITIEANKKVVNFLDVTLDLNKQSYAPYIKPNNKPLYVHRESNHPPLILKNIPLAINRRLNEISSNKELFDEAAPVFQEALHNSGYDYTLKYENINPSSENKAKNRSRNITWFHPPYSKHVTTNVGKKFLSIVHDCFKKSHPLRKIFNKNTIKVSYSCMPNLEAKISSHNKTILANPNGMINDNKQCNCRVKSECPLDGHCLMSNVIYQATVVTDKSTETYIGLTENHFKTRYRNHLASFRDKSKKNATNLSRYIWSLKENNSSYVLRWRILAEANPYSNTNKRCNLCITEKYFILCKPVLCSLNSRNELINTCRHARKYNLSNV